LRVYMGNVSDSDYGTTYKFRVAVNTIERKLNTITEPYKNCLKKLRKAHLNKSLIWTALNAEHHKSE
jgi:hypothetical protein